MRRITAALAGLVVVLSAVMACAQSPCVMEVKGRGVEGKPPYRGGGVVRFLDASMEAQVVHYEPGKEVVLPMGIHGYCLFAYGHLSDPQLEVLRDELNTEPAVPYFR